MFRPGLIARRHPGLKSETWATTHGLDVGAGIEGLVDVVEEQLPLEIFGGLDVRAGIEGRVDVVEEELPSEIFGGLDAGAGIEGLVDAVEEQLPLEIFGQVPDGLQVIAAFTGELVQEPFLLFPG